MPEVIHHIEKIEGVEVMVGDGPKTVECTTRAVSKMHEVINRSPTGRATNPFQVLHFDPTINNVSFDGSRCIAHFTDEFTSFDWVFPLPYPKEVIPTRFTSLIHI